MNIRRLPPEVTAKLRSGVAVSTVAQCVEELVLNSLDAGATCIAVRLDLTFYKVQVVDNGRGISREDLNLVGERYATSKCRIVEDVENMQTYGHRGEALASIGEVSQELTIASRTCEQRVTYVKFVGGQSPGTSVQRAGVQRPAAGTTATVLNFLYNMPVRQLAINSALDVETVRRNLQVHALGHPEVSFSLHDDVSAIWCLRVARTCSLVKTIGQVFGSSWIPLLRSIDGSRGPFRIHGQVALKGYRNKNRQYILVDRRRVVDDHLQRTIDDVFNTFRSNRRSSFLSDLQPVYVLHLDCPRHEYDIGFHPSKLLVEFRHFDLIQALIRDTLRRFLDVHQQSTSTSLDKEQSPLPVPVTVPVAGPQEPVIAVEEYKDSLHSLPAKRPFKPEIVVASEPEILTSPSPSLSSDSSSESQDRHWLYRQKTKSRKVDKPAPIVLSRAIGMVPTVLGRILKMSKEESERRTLATIAELKERYSHKDDRRRQHHRQRRPRHSNAGPDRYNPDTVATSSTSERPMAVPAEIDGCGDGQQMFMTIDDDGDDDDVHDFGTTLVDPPLSVDTLTTTTTTGPLCPHIDDEAFTDDGKSASDLLLVSDEAKLAASQLPHRPWRMKDIGDGDGNDDAIISATAEGTKTPTPTPKTTSSRPHSSSSVLTLYQKWENPILTSGSGSLHMPALRQSTDLTPAEYLWKHSYVFSPAVLQDLLLIGQMDCKFIVCAVPYTEIPELESRPVEPNLIVAFDQHAVHERTRLELLVQEAGFDHDDADCADSKRPPSMSSVDPPLKIAFPAEITRLALKHRTQLYRLFGITVSAAADDEVAEDSDNVDAVWVHSLPSCLLEREASEIRQKRASVIDGLTQDLIMDVIEDLILHRGFRAKMPKVVLNVLKSQACHGALKFGDRLDVATCNDLLVRLGRCLLPFQCAHGRPSVTALADLRRIPRPKQVSKPNLFRLKRAMTEQRTLPPQV